MERMEVQEPGRGSGGKEKGMSEQTDLFMEALAKEFVERFMCVSQATFYAECVGATVEIMQKRLKPLLEAGQEMREILDEHGRTGKAWDIALAVPAGELSKERGQ